MDRQNAVEHLRSRCVPADPGDPAVVAEWQKAMAQLGRGKPPVTAPGKPEVVPIALADRPYIDRQ